MEITGQVIQALQPGARHSVTFRVVEVIGPGRTDERLRILASKVQKSGHETKPGAYEVLTDSIRTSA